MNKKRESNQEDKWRIFKWESTSEKKIQIEKEL